MHSIAALPTRAVLAVGGADRIAFLQGLVSNDVTRAAAHQAVWAALLTPQGKFLAEFFIVADANRLLLDAEVAWADDTLRRLSRYKLRAGVTLERLDWHVGAAWGDQTPDGLAYPDPRHNQAGFRLLSPHPIAATVPFEAYDHHRLTLGLPDGTRDLERDKTVLMEAGFDTLHGIDWDKGCYMGQELTARTRYRGLVKRRLARVAIHGPVPEPGTPVTAGGAEAGTMRSAERGIGLALLRLDAAGPFVCGPATLTRLDQLQLSPPPLSPPPESPPPTSQPPP